MDVIVALLVGVLIGWILSPVVVVAVLIVIDRWFH